MRKPSFLPGLLSLLFLLSGPVPRVSAQAPYTLQKEIQEAARRVLPATVRIRAKGAARGILGSTGVFLDASGLVLSDADATLISFKRTGPGKKPVKTHGKEARVFLPPPDGRVFPARLLRRDPETDTSLLKVDLPPYTRVPSLRICSGKSLVPGMPLLVAGNAFGTAKEGKPAVSFGIFSGWGPGKKPGERGRFLTDAPVNPGTNGGPVVDLAGNLMGVVSTFEASPLSPYRGFGWITPVTMLRMVYKDIPQASPLFGRRRLPRRLPRTASLLAKGIAALAARGAPAVATLLIDRGKARGTKTIPLRRRVPGGPKSIRIPVYGGPCTALCVDPGGFLLTPLSNLWGRNYIKKITVLLGDGRRLDAKISALDPLRGVALLEVNPGEKPLPALPPAEEKIPLPGSLAVAVGRPWDGKTPGGGLLVALGIVSALHQGNVARDAIQTDAGILDSTAGGLLMGATGKYLGMTLLFNPDATGRNSGIGFALPPRVVREAVKRLIPGRNVVRGKLGFGLEQKGPCVFLVTKVEKDGAAERGGMKPGDRILEIGGRGVEHFSTIGRLISYISGYARGDTVPVKVGRNGKTLSLELRAR